MQRKANYLPASKFSAPLTEFAGRLVSSTQETVDPNLPEYTENEGMPPVIGTGLSDDAALAAWLAQRIREIEVFTQQLPSIAVLVNDPARLEPLADALTEALAEMNIRAVACPKGQAIGPEKAVRIFEVEHVKGLEFEGVFFVDIDVLAAEEPDLFDKYIYVGATRAATYLGMTAAGGSVPLALTGVCELMSTDWKSVSG